MEKTAHATPSDLVHATDGAYGNWEGTQMETWDWETDAYLMAERAKGPAVRVSVCIIDKSTDSETL